MPTSCLKLTSLTRPCVIIGANNTGAANPVQLANEAANALLAAAIQSALDCSPSNLVVNRNGQTVILTNDATRAELAADVISQVGCPVKRFVVPGCNKTSAPEGASISDCLTLDTSKRADGSDIDLTDLIDSIN